LALRNGPQGYGVVTKFLHWSTVAALIAQFAVGYLMDVDESGRGRGRGRSRDSGRGRGGEDGYAVDGALAVHVALGVLILSLAVLRVVWRRTGLPPWAEGLSAGERRLAHWTERGLLLLLFAIPLSGLALVLAGDDDALPWHVATHVAFFVVLTAHVGLVLKHQLINRDRLLSRMT
jgi:cytochrome b561